jgi:hypothetical protein
MTTNTLTTRQQIQRDIQAFDFKDLFREVLGWDNLREAALPITVGEQTYALRPLAEKRGVKVYVCDPDAEGKIPAVATLRKIESELTKYAYEHVIIYVDAARTQQAWQWVKRGQSRAQQRLNRYYKGQSGELLAQKLENLAVDISEEGSIHTAEMVARTARAFDVERVTRRFYDRFKIEHDAFLKFIQGISSQADCEWYASLMLNRLMFIYFIQRKGFLDTKAAGALDGDPNYLSNRLKWVQQRRGEDQFHSFYRYFLLRLFHDGLSKREHSPELEELLGRVPYLNGGLFDIHTLERAYPDINIPDEAFEKLFAFFDDYDWHLDDRPLRNDREINPDVLGYIFEKYINQKQMGAYYTKEDITGYISKNTIIPYIFDAAEQKCLVAFAADGPIWSLLRLDPDRYIYEAVKKGAELPLPPEIAAGVQDVAQRGEWNKPAPEDYALPTEIWREVVARRARYQEVKAKLAAGEITSINDLITYNLDIVTFADDAIACCEGSDLLRAFYDSIRSVTVLDPTCGSGAFLFAALNILEKLYEACLQRMQEMIAERDQLDAALPAHKRQQQPRLDYFRSILREADRHPSRQYFIYKSIIVNNLYGVDIMEEATEICKLRLFLKLVSQVNQFNDIEPLPDIDFNIRAGNTLVGFASLEETKRAIEGKSVGKGAFQGQMIFDDRLERIEQKAQEVERAFDHFRKLQTDLQLEPTDVAAYKQQMREKLAELRAELDGYLASEYGIDRSNSKTQAEYEEKFAHWQQTHQPFHWWVEFYGIMKRGGFDVIVGNPPYVEYKNIKAYRVRDYSAEACGDLFAFTLERAIRLTSTHSRNGFIVPMSCFTVDGFASLQELYFQTNSLLFISNWSGDAHPSKLFEGVDKRLEIILSQRKEDSQSSTVFASKYLKWYSDERPELFHRQPNYEKVRDIKALRVFPTSVPKIGSDLEVQIIEKLRSYKKTIGSLSSPAGKHMVYYTRKASFFLQFLDFVPEVHDNEGNRREPSELKTLSFESEDIRDICLASLSSSLFYWYYIVNSDCRNLNKREIISFPIPGFIPVATHSELKALLKRLMDSYRQNSMLRTVKYANKGNITVQYFNFRPSKPIIDEIDRVLARHYGFTDEELDFIINYDIKYRMGQNGGDEGEE